MNLIIDLLNTKTIVSFNLISQIVVQFSSIRYNEVGCGNFDQAHRFVTSSLI